MAQEETNAASSESSQPGALRPSDLAIVLSHFNLGVIESIEPIARGSERSPKFHVRTQKGQYVVKRRLERREDLDRVAYTHEVQEELVKSGFPAPPLIRTARHRGTLVVHSDRLYELLGYVHGSRYAHTTDQTRSAGAALSRFHDILAEFHPAKPSPPGLEGRADRVRTQLDEIDSQSSGEPRAAAKTLREGFDEASAAREKIGVDSWTPGIVHGDWHPGNMLFNGSQLAAVTDYDTARRAPRIEDVANGLLQFSITRESGHPRTWPEHVDLARFSAFGEGYRTQGENDLEESEQEAVPWLMIEAIVAESVGPVATTGRFAAIEGGAFLVMVSRKVGWLRENAERLTTVLRELTKGT